MCGYYSLGRGFSCAAGQYGAAQENVGLGMYCPDYLPCFMAACAAARRAIGTRKGLHET